MRGDHRVQLGHLAGSETGGREHRRAEDVVGAVRHQERSLDLRHERREIHLLHRETGLAHRVGVVDADHRADGRERVLALLALEEGGADGLRRDVVGEVVPRHRLRHPSPDAEEGRTVDVGLREGDVGARRDHAVTVVRREGDRDHPAHRGAVDEDALELQRVEQLRAVVGPALDRVPLARARRGAVAARVEREQPEAGVAKAVVDEAEVVPAEEAAAELDHHGPVVGPGQLVVELDSLVDLRVRHAPSLTDSGARRLSPRCGRRDPTRRRSGATRC